MNHHSDEHDNFLYTWLEYNIIAFALLAFLMLFHNMFAAIIFSYGAATCWLIQWVMKRKEQRQQSE